MNKTKKKIIIASGGTGGHIFPAYGLARHFIRKNIEVKISSDARGMKYLKNFPNINIIKIPSSTIYNKNIFRLSISLTIIFYSIFRSLLFLLKYKPNLIFGMGGYSSFPVCLAAKLVGIPFVIYENNLHIGKANKYLSPYAKKILVSYKEAEGIPCQYKKKVFEIGNIIRKKIIDFSQNRQNYSKDKKLSILVLGGSQAAKVFAEVLPKIFEKCAKKNIPLKIFQQCLPYQKDNLSNFYSKLKIDHKIFYFSNNILDYFSKANLAITRSGSSMLAELVNANIPFVSVPLPSSADNHQLKNAIFYQNKGYSYLIKEKDLNIKLFELIRKIKDNRTLLDQMKKKQKKYSDKSVYKNIDRVIKEIINEKY